MNFLRNTPCFKAISFHLLKMRWRAIPEKAKDILDMTYRRRVTVTPEQLVFDALPAESKELFIRAIKNLCDHSWTYNYFLRQDPECYFDNLFCKGFWIAMLLS